jgi:hypothetical protein
MANDDAYIRETGGPVGREGVAGAASFHRRIPLFLCKGASKKGT